MSEFDIYRADRFIKAAEVVGDEAIQWSRSILAQHSGASVVDRYDREQFSQAIELVIAKLSHLKLCVQSPSKTVTNERGGK